MKDKDPAPLLEIMTRAALAAGQSILEVYDTPISATRKEDGTPVTIADQRAEEIILEFLKTTEIPVLGEESAAAGLIPELGKRFFVVDPLDGTREFLKKNDEFTVNIALIEDGRPIAGVVTAPALGRGFCGNVRAGAFCFSIASGNSKETRPIKTRGKGPLHMLSSRSHHVPIPADLLEYLGNCRESSVGSSLKFCLIANGEARLYPRLSVTSEWDTAAGQAVLEAAGGAVIDLDGKPLSYGKADRNYLNPFFVAADRADLAKKISGKLARAIKAQAL